MKEKLVSYLEVYVEENRGGTLRFIE